MNNSRIAAAIVTAVAAVLILILLLVGKLTLSDGQWPPPERPVTELVEIEEEFIDLFDPAPVHANPSPAYKAEKASNLSKPAKAAGTDLADAGKAADPSPVVTTERPSPVVAPKKDNPPKTGPDADAKKKKEEEEARRRAQSGVSNAFKATQDAQDNTANKGRESGDSGNPDGAASDLNGTGSGTVGGGWIMPKYSKVDSRQTGSIILKAVINQAGQVVSVEQSGGKAPASANSALVEKCKAEVRRHRFTRNDDNAPKSTTATITYTFR